MNGQLSRNMWISIHAECKLALFDANKGNVGSPIKIHNTIFKKS